MFVGQYDHNLDEKGRLTIPARYREQLEDGAYITQGLDKNAMVLTSSLFERLSRKVNEKSMTDPTALLFRRVIFSNAFQVEVDKAGRILIPQILRDENGLEGSLIVSGAGDWFEIWSQPCWAEQKAKMRDFETNQQRFAAMDLSVRE
jgi:MraZ protein